MTEIEKMKSYRYPQNVQDVLRNLGWILERERLSRQRGGEMGCPGHPILEEMIDRMKEK